MFPYLLFCGGVWKGLVLILPKCLVEITSEVIWSWAFVYWEFFNFESTLIISNRSIIFSILHDSVLIGFMFPGIHLFSRFSNILIDEYYSWLSLIIFGFILFQLQFLLFHFSFTDLSPLFFLGKCRKRFVYFFNLSKNSS